MKLLEIQVNILERINLHTVLWYCDGKSTKIPKRDFIFARVKTGQIGT